ncbi:MAG: YrdB family protein, partial [Thermomicrobiales bacterium]
MITDRSNGPNGVSGDDVPPTTPVVVLGARFLLELFGLVGFGVWGWATGEGGLWGGTLAAVLVIAAAAVWGTFRVRHDPPGKTDHPVIVPGVVRLAIELAFFGLAAAGLWLGGSRAASETLMTCVVVL